MWKYFVLFFINRWSSCEPLQGPAMLWGLSSWQERQLFIGQTRAHFLPSRPAEIFYSQTDFHSFSWAGRHCSLIKHNTSEDRHLSCSQIYYLKTEWWSMLVRRGEASRHDASGRARTEERGWKHKSPGMPPGTSLMVRWLRFLTPNTGGPGSILVRELDPTCHD